MVENELAAPKKRGRRRKTPNYEDDPNVQARNRAGERRTPVTKVEEPDVEDGSMVPEQEILGDESGGIVAEAQKEVETTAEALEEVLENGSGAEGEEVAEGESTAATDEPTAIEEYAKEEATEPEHQGSDAVEKFAEEEMQEPQHQKPMAERVGEYVPPEGATHDELIDQWHEALAFGDMEGAKTLYKQLQEHRYQENTHRTKSEAQAAKDAQDYLDAANIAAAKYPQLAEDGMESEKVLALMDVYRMHGATAAEALTQAVADLYGESSVSETASEPTVAEAAPEETVPEPTVAEAAPEETVPEPTVAEAAPEETVPEPAVAEAVSEPVIPDMSARQAQKRKIVNLPGAAARNEPPPPEKPMGRPEAIDFMKRARGQK